MHQSFDDDIVKKSEFYYVSPEGFVLITDEKTPRYVSGVLELNDIPHDVRAELQAEYPGEKYFFCLKNPKLKSK